MLPVLEKVLKPQVARPEPSAREENAKLHITVVFTSVDSTLHALREAGKLASRLNAALTLIVPQIVPYPLPLSSPPVLLDFTERCFRVLAGESPVETTVRIYLCRERDAMLRAALEPRSLVVIAAPKHWWPTADKATVRRLRREGHEVLFIES